jgi:hypothetical protein
MVESTLSIRLNQVPIGIRRKIAAGDDVNLSEIGRSLTSIRSGKPIGKDLVYRVLMGSAFSTQVRTALETELARVLTPNNKYGWWPGMPPTNKK